MSIVKVFCLKARSSMQDEQKADGHVLDLEIKISDLKYELGV